MGSRGARDTGTMSETNVEVVRRSLTVYNRGDFEEFDEINHPDVEVDWSASRGLEAEVYRGKEEVLRFYREFLEMFEVHIEPERFVESGDWVVVPNTTRVRGRDGIETVARSAFAFEVRDGRIALIRLYQETEEALESVGAGAKDQR